MFCKNCGNQLSEEARFCSVCGNEVVPLPTVEPTIGPAKKPVPAPEAKPEPMATTEKKESYFSLIFTFICKVFAILSATFCGCALAESRGLLSYHEIKQGLYNDYGMRPSDLTDGLRVHLSWEETCATIALITAIVALTLALGWLIYTIAKQRRCKPILSAITRLLAAGGLLAVAICLCE